jgi:DNA-binding NarL/FixJ family response regulator
LPCEQFNTIALKLVLVDDNTHFREDLRFFLENRLIHNVIAEAASGEEFLALENLCEADIILMDLSMEKINGFIATKKILGSLPHLKIIAVTMNAENVELQRVIEAGFKGFIFKTEIFKSLESVLQSVYADGYAFSGKFSKFQD